MYTERWLGLRGRRPEVDGFEMESIAGLGGLILAVADTLITDRSKE